MSQSVDFTFGRWRQTQEFVSAVRDQLDSYIRGLRAEDGFAALVPEMPEKFGVGARTPEEGEILIGKRQPVSIEMQWADNHPELASVVRNWLIEKAEGMGGREDTGPGGNARLDANTSPTPAPFSSPSLKAERPLPRSEQEPEKDLVCAVR